MTEQQKQFLTRLKAPAHYSEMRWSIPAAITMAQAILESSTEKGWGTSPLFTELNNPFGIKTHQRLGSEPYGEFSTREDLPGGQSEIVNAKFVKFDSLEDAFRQHGQLFWTDRYQAVIDACKTHPGDFKTIAQAIQDCGYSTSRDGDPQSPNFGQRNYADKLLKIIRLDVQPFLSGTPVPEFTTENTENMEAK